MWAKYVLTSSRTNCLLLHFGRPPFLVFAVIAIESFLRNMRREAGSIDQQALSAQSVRSSIHCLNYYYPTHISAIKMN